MQGHDSDMLKGQIITLGTFVVTNRKLLRNAKKNLLVVQTKNKQTKLN